jgi:hypothetical protein
MHVFSSQIVGWGTGSAFVVVRANSKKGWIPLPISKGCVRSRDGLEGFKAISSNGILSPECLSKFVSGRISISLQRPRASLYTPPEPHFPFCRLPLSSSVLFKECAHSCYVELAEARMGLLLACIKNQVIGPFRIKRWKNSIWKFSQTLSFLVTWSNGSSSITFT